MKCPNCGAEVFVKGSQWECGWCGNCGRLAPVPQPAPTVRLTIRPQTQSASPTPASPKNAPAPWTSPTWQLRLKNYFAEDPTAALALWREYHYEIPDEAIETGLRDAKMPARIEVMRRHPLLLLDGCHNADGTAALAATLKEAGYDGNLVAVLGLLKDKDHSKMLENLAPCFEKVFTVTPDSPRAMTAEELEEEAKYHMDAEAAPSVAKAIRLAVDYADENNLAGVVVCGSLYLAAQARPLLLKEAEK